MVKLKTLNEFIPCYTGERIETNPCKNCGMNHSFSEELLRKEAVNWIVYLKRKQSKHIGESLHWICINEQIKWIKMFFNLK